MSMATPFLTPVPFMALLQTKKPLSALGLITVFVVFGGDVLRPLSTPAPVAPKKDDYEAKNKVENGKIFLHKRFQLVTEG